jgi:RNA polymerase sigma factor (sigma-70 family)
MKTKKYFLLFLHSRKKDKRTDAELALGCASGDKQCFNILAERHRKPLHEFLYRLLHSNARADDALQQTWLLAWLILSKGNYNNGDMGKWLSTIAYHQAMLLLRKEKNMVHPEQMPEQCDEVQEDEWAKQKKILDTLIAQLPAAGEREIIFLHDKMEMDYMQIGRQFGIRPSSARRTHERAVDALKRMLAGRRKSE